MVSARNWFIVHPYLKFVGCDVHTIQNNSHLVLIAAMASG